jgi:hypothetical protein
MMTAERIPHSSVDRNRADLARAGGDSGPELRSFGRRGPTAARTQTNRVTPHTCFLKLVQDSGSLLRVLFWRNLPIGEQLIDSRKSLLHGLLWFGQTFDLSMRAELLHEHLHSRCYVVNVSGR